jgi:enoyl-CoA hydratase
MAELVLAETLGFVRRLTLNRPDKLNALNGALCEALVEALQAAEQDDAVAVVVLAGSGRAFSAGADMKEGQTHRDRTHRQVIQAASGRAQSGAVVQALLDLSKPVIAAVNGFALGAGSALAIASDIVVAGEGAVFGYPEVRRGLAATAVTPTLVAQVGRKVASELLLLCENVGAAEAKAMGLVNRVVPDAETMPTAMRLAEAIAGFDHDALWMTKRMIRRSADLPLDQAHAMARDNMLVMRGFEK